MFYPTHRHADGGLYQYMGPMKGKSRLDCDNWTDGVAYRNEEGMMFWTSEHGWSDRFDPVRPDNSRDLMIWDDQNNSVAAFRFSTVDAGDVRYLLTSANPQKSSIVSPEFIDWMKKVLQMQAEMVAKGLHIRDHDFPDLIGDVAAFHAKFGQEYTGKPRMLPQDLHDFRVNFHKEETTEYSDEYELLCAGIVDADRREILHRLEKQLDALADAVWVVLGTADLQFGRRVFYEAWRRVVKANMAKITKAQTTDGDGSIDSGREPKYDIVKPAGWLPPDHSDLIEDNAIFDELFGLPAPDVETNTHNQDAGSYSDTRAI